MSFSDAPPLSPLEQRSVIEIDTFCAGCYYNLHGQVVTIDPHLSIPVCRCPECGRYHPAGTGVTASSVWVRRFATILLFNWVLLVISGFIVIGAAMAGSDAASIGMYEHGFMAAPDGRAVYWSNGKYMINGTDIVIAIPVYVRQLYPWNTASDQPGPGLNASLLMGSISLMLGLIAGTLCVTLLWHWQKPFYFGSLLGPLIPATLISIPFLTQPEYLNLHRECMQRIGSHVGLQCLGILLGVIFGRSISRGIIRSIIPPKPRQALAFLWIVDGKTLPINK